MKYIDEIFESYKNNNKGLVNKFRHDKEFLSELIKETSFLPNDTTASERCWYYMNGLKEIQLCPYCNTRKRRFKKMDKGLFSTCGSEECKKAGMSKGAKSERDWEAIQAKMKATYKERTGYEHNMQNPEFVKKFKEDFAKNHDGLLCGCLTEKARKNFFENFDKNLIEKAKSKNIEIEKIENDYVYSHCTKCQHKIDPLERNVFNRYLRLDWNLCKNCYPEESHSRSNFEEQVYVAIKDFYKGELKTNRKIGSNKFEFDIIIPEFKICIECNGLYYHSEIKLKTKYHIEKKEYAEQNGYSCIMIWEDEWHDKIKKDIILSRIKGLLEYNEKIFARNTEFVEISIKECNEFLEENHLQGGSTQGKFAYALKYKDEIIQVVLIGQTRNYMRSSNRCIDYELIRMCTKKGCSVVGGFSKIISHIKELLKGSTMISFADLSWSNATLENVYDKVGFINEGYTALSYWWFFKNIRHNRIKYSKSSLVKAGFDKNLSESEIMHQEFKALKIFGPGNLRYFIQL